MTWKKYSWRLTLNINVNFLKQSWTDENITWINTAIPFYTEWKTLKSIKSKTLKPGCRLVSIFWTINHFSDTRAVFTPTLDSPVMHCTLPCTVPVHYGQAGTLHCTPLFNKQMMKSCLGHLHTTLHWGQVGNTFLFCLKHFLWSMEFECKYGVKMAIKWTSIEFLYSCLLENSRAYTLSTVLLGIAIEVCFYCWSVFLRKCSVLTNSYCDKVTWCCNPLKIYLPSILLLVNLSRNLYGCLVVFSANRKEDPHSLDQSKPVESLVNPSLHTDWDCRWEFCVEIL